MAQQRKRITNGDLAVALAIVQTQLEALTNLVAEQSAGRARLSERVRGLEKWQAKLVGAGMLAGMLAGWALKALVKWPA